ncbi:MAG: DUF2189 domain-containing protein [Rhodobacteraceae bacterium]|nr:DUF2189 domain-containing protein [Paracoccaceae bacterium]
MAMTDTTVTAPVQVAQDLTEDDLRAALQKGWDDFKAQPIFGLFFAGFYTLGGLLLYFGLIGQGQAAWFIPIAAGFPLLAPFAAVGLYEVSRRREAGEPMDWPGVLGALRGRGNEQLLLMAVTVLIVFGFWIILARGIFAMFFSLSGIGYETLGMLFSFTGISMVFVGSVVGALVALALFTITVTSLPMLLDRDVDFVTAMITSAEVVRSNHITMLKWAGVIAVAVFAAMIPLFLGLLVVLPVLGHATWHLYRRGVPVEAPAPAGQPAAEDRETVHPATDVPTPPPADVAPPAAVPEPRLEMQSARPTGMSAPRDGKADDLKKLAGIGPKLEATLNDMGYWHYDQIADWTEAEVAWVDDHLEGFKGRATRDNWVEQARKLAGRDG